MKFRELIEYNILLESLDSIIKQTKDIDPDTIKMYHKYALPDNNKSDRLLNHVLKMHRNGELKPWDSALVKRHLSMLHNTNNISRLRNVATLDDLRHITRDIHSDKELSKKEVINKNAPVILKNDNIKITKYMNQESMIKGGYLSPHNVIAKDTLEPGKASWCISADTDEGKMHFDNYTNRSQYLPYTIETKERKYALVPNPKDFQIRDEMDKEVHPMKIMYMDKDIPNSEIGKHIIAHNSKIAEIISKYPIGCNKEELLKSLHTKDAEYTVLHPDLTKEDLHNILNSKAVHPIVQSNAFQNDNIDETHIDKALSSNYKSVTAAALSHVKVNEGHLNKALDSNTFYIKDLALENPNLSENNINKALDDSSADTREIALYHKNVTPNNINKALDDADYNVRNAALTHKNTSEDNLLKALNDRDSRIAYKALIHKNATQKTLLAGLKIPSNYVYSEKIHTNKLIDNNFIKTALQDNDVLDEFKTSLISHPEFKKEHIELLPYKYQREYAESKLNKQ